MKGLNMNTDKIKELSQQAHLYACEQYGLQRKGELVWNPDTYEMKLAELIVLECIKIAHDTRENEVAGNNLVDFWFGVQS